VPAEEISGRVSIISSKVYMGISASDETPDETFTQCRRVISDVTEATSVATTTLDDADGGAAAAS